MRVGVGGRDEVCVCARVRIACACAWSRGELALWTPRTPVAIQTSFRAIPMHLNLRRSTHERSSSRLDDVLLGLSGRGQFKWPDSRRICADNAGPTHSDGSRRLGVWGGECTSGFNYARSEVAPSTRKVAATLASPVTNYIWECGKHEMQLARRGLGRQWASWVRTWPWM